MPRTKPTAPARPVAPVTLAIEESDVQRMVSELPSALRVLLKRVPGIAEFINYSHSEQMRRERNRGKRLNEWNANFLHYLDIRINDFDTRLEDIAKQIEGDEFARVLENYQIESVREATDDRHRMLAAAAAGTLNPRLTIQQLARVERVLRELDPNDVKLLWRVERACGQPHKERLRLDVLRGSSSSEASVDALYAAHCVAGDMDGVAVTQTGSWILRILRAYLEEEVDDETIPGRERRSGEPDASAAAAGFEAEHPVVCRFLDRLKKSEARYGAQYVMPHPDAKDEVRKGCIILNLFDPYWVAEAQKLVASFDGGVYGKIRLELRKYTEPEHMQMQIGGPHGYLRHWADRFSTEWMTN